MAGMYWILYPGVVIAVSTHQKCMAASTLLLDHILLGLSVAPALNFLGALFYLCPVYRVTCKRDSSSVINFWVSQNCVIVFFSISEIFTLFFVYGLGYKP